MITAAKEVTEVTDMEVRVWGRQGWGRMAERGPSEERGWRQRAE